MSQQLPETRHGLWKQMDDPVGKDVDAGQLIVEGFDGLGTGTRDIQPFDGERSQDREVRMSETGILRHEPSVIVAGTFDDPRLQRWNRHQQHRVTLHPHILPQPAPFHSR